MKIVVADPNLPPHLDLLTSLLPVEVDLRVHHTFAEDDVVADMADAQVYVGGRVTPAIARASDRLRLVHVFGAGTDRISWPDLAPTVAVANTFHHEDSIAEYVLATALILRRGFLEQDRALRRDVWASPAYDRTIPQPTGMRDCRVGFVGFGHIGARSWQLLRTMGATGRAVTGSGRVSAEDLDWVGDTSQLGRLMGDSDIVVLSAPLTDGTRGMVGADELAALGPEGILINVGRGPLVDPEALYTALSRRIIGAAAIDVWYDYPTAGRPTPPAALPFRELPNLIMTPHSSGISRETFIGRTRDVARNICRLAAGQPLERLVARPVANV